MNGYRELCADKISKEQAQELMPDRAMLAMVWKYLSAVGAGVLQENPMCLCRKIVRWSGMPLSLGQLMTCLDIFADVELLTLQRLHKYIEIRLAHPQVKADLNESRTMQRLQTAKESGT